MNNQTLNLEKPVNPRTLVIGSTVLVLVFLFVALLSSSDASDSPQAVSPLQEQSNRQVELLEQISSSSVIIAQQEFQLTAARAELAIVVKAMQDLAHQPEQEFLKSVTVPSTSTDLPTPSQ